MSTQTPQELDISIGRIFLDLTNPRFEAVQSEEQAIKVLCEDEDVYPLASDIVSEKSLNPLERVALVATGPKPSNPSRQNYTVIEGNRRICALKLLIDPELAPANLRKRFMKLSEQWDPIKSVRSVVFKSEDDVKVWLKRMHEGLLGGIGRKSWNADQKQRFSGSAKNQAAQDLLDYFEEKNLITKKQRLGKLTTVQRFVTKDLFKEHFGIESPPGEDLQRTRVTEEFDKISKTFIEDLLGGVLVNSRMNKKEINDYARKLIQRVEVSEKKIDPEPLRAIPNLKRTRRKPKPNSPKPPKHLVYSDGINKALKEFKNTKLQSLYASLVNIELTDHTPILSVGLWSFIETATACAGRNEANDFGGFLSKHRMEGYGIKGRENQKAITSAIRRIQEFGNQTKHHSSSAAFNGQQLNNDLECLEVLIVGILSDAVGRKSGNNINP